MLTRVKFIILYNFNNYFSVHITRIYLHYPYYLLKYAYEYEKSKRCDRQ